MITLDEINSAICTSPEDPDFQEFGYRFWTRGLIPSTELNAIRMGGQKNNALLVGLCVAYPQDDTPRDKIRCFAAVIGGSYYQEYRPGDRFEIDDCVINQNTFPPNEKTFEFIKREKEATMNRLRECVRKAVS